MSLMPACCVLACERKFCLHWNPPWKKWQADNSLTDEGDTEKPLQVKLPWGACSSSLPVHELHFRVRCAHIMAGFLWVSCCSMLPLLEDFITIPSARNVSCQLYSPLSFSTLIWVCWLASIKLLNWPFLSVTGKYRLSTFWLLSILCGSCKIALGVWYWLLLVQGLKGLASY